jgi:hypothetical protein
MSCCKAPKNSNSESISKNPINIRFGNIFVFLLMMLLLPVIIVGIIIILFYHIVLSNRVDLIPVLRYALKRLNGQRKPEIVMNTSIQMTINSKM